MNSNIILVVWNVFLSIFMLYLWFLLRKIFPKNRRGLKQLIEDSLYKGASIEKNITLLKDLVNKHQNRTKKHLQKVGLVRFNPFERLGGEQSYCVAFLAENEGGVVITFLHTKSGVRVYIKEVAGGKGKGADLSKEEKEAILKATKL